MDTLQHIIGYVCLGGMLAAIGIGWYRAVWVGTRGDDYNG